MSRNPKLKKTDDPYKILFIAIPFLIGGTLCLLQKRSAAVMIHPEHHAPGSYHDTISPSMQHSFGVAEIAIGVSIVLFYFYLRRQIRKEPADREWE